MPGRSRKSARGIAGSLQLKFLRRVGVEQIRLQHAVLDDYCAARGYALAIERARAESADNRAIVDDVDVVAGNLLSQLASKKRRAAINRVSVDALENVLQDRVGNHGIKMIGHLGGLCLACAQTAQRALGGDLSYYLGRIQLFERARTEYQ